VLFAFEAIAVKLIGRRQSPLPILLVNNAIGLGLSSAAVAFVWTWPAPAQWPMLAGVGLAVVSAQACFLLAMRAADASFCAPFFYATLVFAALLDLAVFAEAPDALAALGAATVVAGALLVAWRDRAATRELARTRRSARARSRLLALEPVEKAVHSVGIEQREVEQRHRHRIGIHR
jgi:drug/metabolite transporter (DMT)-like permease